MNKGGYKNILIVLLLTIAVFSVFKYSASLKEKYALLDALNQLKEQAALLEKEKQNLLESLEKEKELQQKLTEEKSELKENLKASRKRLMKFFREARETEKAIEQLNLRFSVLEAENKALIERDNNLKLKFLQVSQENESLKARLSSITELKNAIRELKKQKRTEVVKETKQEMKELGRIIEGNRGFLIKDGKFTYPTKLKIEVIPAPLKTEFLTGPAPTKE